MSFATAADSNSTLVIITQHAQANFADAFKIVSDSSYRFESRAVEGEDSEVLLVHIGSYDPRSDRVNRLLWARPSGDTVAYYHGRDGQELTHWDDDDAPIPNEGALLYKDRVAPFSFVVPRVWPPKPSQTAAFVEARTLARTRLAFLTRLVFLLSGYESHLHNMSRADLLSDLQQLCMYMQQNKQLVETEAEPRLTTNPKEEKPHRQLPVVHSQPARTPVLSSDSAFGSRRLALERYGDLGRSGYEGKSAVVFHAFLLTCFLVPHMSSNVNVSGRNWKRTASDMDGTGVETEVRGKSASTCTSRICLTAISNAQAHDRA